MSTNRTSVNRVILIILSPALILVGVAGFLTPEAKGLTSGATPYNIFHIVFGLIGIALWLLKNARWAIGFNISFGLIDLYQAFASYAHLFPEQYFHWTRTDDALHIFVGLALALIGSYGAIKRADAG